jgi:site-specific DNA recombinase
MIPILGAARLSDVTDESTALERQEASINSWATFKTQSTGNAHEVIHITQDPDVSGAVSPFKRDGLGPWLESPKLNRWQVLVVHRLDRLTRSIQDFEQIYTYLEAYGKTLVSVQENIDFSTPHGRLIGRQLVLFAEYEREMIKARVRDAYVTMRQRGQYPGMQFPFGYMPQKLDPKGWELIPHPVYGATAAEIVDKLLAGESLGSICRWLEDQAIPTPRNVVREYGNEIRLREGRPVKPIPASHWQPTSLAKILRSPAIVGESTANGDTLRDARGFAIKRSEPLIPREKWEQAKAILDHNADNQGPRANASPLLHIAYCADCGSRLYVNQVTTDGKLYRYYLCPNANRGRGCKARRVNAHELESFVERELYSGPRMDSEVVERIPVPVTDHSTRIAELAEAIGALAKEIAYTKARGGDTSTLEANQEINQRNLDEFAAMRDEKPPPPILRKTGETYRQRWDRMNAAERNAFMRKSHVRVEATRAGRGKPSFILWHAGIKIAES